MEDKVNQTLKVASTSFPVLSILGLIFITLKLLGKITWSWWWVTCPFWAPLAIWGFLACLVVMFIGVLFGVSMFGKKLNKPGK